MKQEAIVKVVGLYIYPVKSTGARAISSTYAERFGFTGDREWMVVDAAGELVSARECPQLLAITADNRGTGVDADLQLSRAGMPELHVTYPTGGHMPVSMFGRPPLPALPAGADADAWLRKATGRSDIQLVWCDDPARRTLNPAWSTTDDHARFPDGSPMTLLSLASLEQLNSWQLESDPAAEPLSPLRFRPNIIVDGDEPFAEDDWQQVQIGDLRLRVAHAIDRCSMTLIDPVTRERGKEPIRTLARHRKWDGKTWFCSHLLPDNEATISIGDHVEAR